MSGAAFTPDPSWPTITELAIKVWGEPNKALSTREELRWGTWGSKSLKPRTWVWFDNEANEGGGYRDMWQLAHPGEPLPPRQNGQDDGHNGQRPGKTFEGPKPWLDIGTVYRYLDSAGQHVLDVVRTRSGKPRFRQRRPDPSKAFGWSWKTRDIPFADRPLYRLPELVASGDLLEAPMVFITEGEKDADNLAARGLIATTNSGGAGKWHPAYARQLLGRSVVILPDNDQPGRDHAVIVATSLQGAVGSVRVLELPDLAHKGDVSDWLAAGGTVEALERLAREAPVWVPPAAPPPPVEPAWPPEPDIPDVPPPGEPGGGPRPDEPPELPVIICAAGDLPRMVRQAEAALIKAGIPIYQRTMLVQPVSVEYDAANGRKTHSTALVEIPSGVMLEMLSEAAIWQRWNVRQRAFVVCDPPETVVKALLGRRGRWTFPVIRGVLTTPTLRHDGSLLVTPGYDPVSRYFLAFPSNLVMREIPKAPTEEQARDSLARLKALLSGYAFVDDGGISHSVALAMLMTQVLRCAMAVSPLLAVSATAPGTGKSHLVDLCSHIATGRWCPIMNAGKDDNETEKGINTKLISGVPGFSIDNVHKMLNLEALNTASERPLLSPRNFGSLTDTEIESGSVIYQTGNNLDVVDEQIRRTMICKMDAGQENPERRRFTTDPIETVLADRGRYIADILTIARAFIAAGEPVDADPYGSYPGWDRVVRRPLLWLGEPDPLDCQKSMTTDDPVRLRRGAIIDAWHRLFGTGSHTLQEAVTEAQATPVWFEKHGEDPDDKAVRMAEYTMNRDMRADLLAAVREAFPAGRDGVDIAKWSGWMRRFAGRPTDGLKFQRDTDVSKHHGGAKWRLVPT